MKIVIEDRKVSNIPILDVYEADAKEKRPILIMLHGANGRKEKYIQSIQPLNFADNIKEFPLLILNREKDELISINDVRQAYSILQDRFMNKELIKFIEFEGIGHTVTQEALESACEWLEKNI